jgi:hypothetical protein
MRQLIGFAALALCGCDGAAEKVVRQAMLDPEAAQFRDVEVCPQDGGMSAGYVNGKNLLGAYTGFRPFLASAEGVIDTRSSEFQSSLDRCFGANPELTSAAMSRRLSISVDALKANHSQSVGSAFR